MTDHIVDANKKPDGEIPEVAEAIEWANRWTASPWHGEYSIRPVNDNGLCLYQVIYYNSDEDFEVGASLDNYPHASIDAAHQAAQRHHNRQVWNQLNGETQKLILEAKGKRI